MAKTGKGGKGGAKKATPKVVAKVVPYVPQTQVNTGPSTCDEPVATVFVTCINATTGNGGTLLPRATYHKLCREQGVNHNTTRTQVQAYFRWVANGSDPTKLPRAVSL